MLAGYAEWPGYGCTPSNGFEGFNNLFTKGKSLNNEKTLNGIDALILWGGSDIATSFYDEKPYNSYQSAYPSKRDLFEWELLRRAQKKGVPIIGVCRGAQLMCAFAGGKLVQDVSHHQISHPVVTYDKKVFNDVKSAHHQMMFPYALTDDEYEVLATVPQNRSSRYEGLSKDEKECFTVDGFLEPECIFFPTIKGFAIQGHPEWENGSAYQKWLEIEVLVRLFGESKESK